MFKTSAIIITMLASNLAGVCCAAGMPMVPHHHGMMSFGYSDAQTASQVQPFSTACDSQAVNTSTIERDLDSGCATYQRINRGASISPIDDAAPIAAPIMPRFTQPYYHNGCGFDGLSPPQILEQSTGNQLLF